MSAADVIGYVNAVVYGVLAVVAVRQWRRQGDAAAAWAAAAFGSLGAVVALSPLAPDDPHGAAETLWVRIEVAVLVAFPYLLYRFTTVFGPSTQQLERAIGALTASLVVWTFALPDIPAAGEDRPGWFWAYLVVFLVHWTALSVIVAVRLWRAGRGQPSVARRRMRLLAFASFALTAAIFLVVGSSEPDSKLAAASGAVGTVSAIAFLLGLAPPPALRALWRRPELQEVQEAMQGLVALAHSPREIVERVLPGMTRIVGAKAIAYVERDGTVLAADGVPTELADDAVRGRAPRAVNGRVVDLALGDARLLVWTSAYAPFFGDEELQILRTIGALTSVAADRARLFQQEHAARIGLEQADELKTNFVALAAHELRTPVTTIHGFANTLNRLDDRLSEERRRQLLETLEREASRMAALVEQLLDLSRLDAHAVEIVPQEFSVRDRVAEVVQTAAGPREVDVAVEIPADLVATADVDAFDRIVSNLVTNALRYGEPPVIVRAQQTDRHFRLVVEDRGDGVAEQFVPQLFERFARSVRSREQAGGTGLGLAIARSYARAHNGDLFYERAEPHGARFQLLLPVDGRV